MKQSFPIIAALLLILVNCSHKETREKLVKPIDVYGAVTVEGQASEQKEEVKVSNPDRIRFGGVGPEVPTKNLENIYVKKNKKIPIVAVILSPGINRVSGHVSLLNSLKKAKVPIHLISGSGLSAVIAAMFAKGITPEKIEWNFYKFFHAAKNKKPYTEDWLEVVDEVLLKQLEKLNIQDLELSFVLPLYSRSKGKVVYISRGSLYENLKKNFNFFIGLKESQYSTAFQWKIFHQEYFKRRGADLVVGIDVLCDKIDLRQGDNFIIGAFGKSIGMIRSERKDLDFFSSLPICDLSLDSVDNLPSFLLKSLKAGEVVSIEIKKMIGQWQRGEFTKSNKLKEKLGKEDEKEVD